MTESYTSGRLGIGPRSREARGLLSFHSANHRARVDELVGRAEECCAALRNAFGFEARGKDILDVGPGQFLIQSRYFALEGKVTGLDAEVILDRFSARGLVDTLRHNGLRRAVKTVVRRAAGIDRMYVLALRQRLGVDALPAVDLRRGDACRMPFPENSFDMVYCRAVLHHLDDPRAALQEMRRVLRAGGVAWVELHPYSSWNGSLDPRVMFGGDQRLYWGHLQHGPSEVVDGARLNKLRLSEWRELFSRAWPGSKFELVVTDHPVLQLLVDQLIAAGRVEGYSREELLTTTAVAFWQNRA
ncbi:MAG TPA: methyltransferase domain-containing protein [Candidatus Aquilonibacter sp.]|nr:methyltransferase domain-containing protein [Candidatus Aquilonibacter sp.]